MKKYIGFFLLAIVAISNYAQAEEAARAIQPMFKGVELYSWQDKSTGEWRFPYYPARIDKNHWKKSQRLKM